MSGSVVANFTWPSVLTLPRVRGNASNENRTIIQHTDHMATEDIQRFDVAQLRLVPRMRAMLRSGSPLGRREGDVSNPQRDGGHRDG
jgi:hypothetical protein